MTDDEHDDLLDAAARALREETEPDSSEDATLGRVLGSLDGDVLDTAAHALRDETRGDQVSGDATLGRVLGTLDVGVVAVPRRRARLTPWLAIAAAAILAAAIGGPSALAWWRGVLSSWNADALPTPTSPPDVGPQEGRTHEVQRDEVQSDEVQRQEVQGDEVQRHEVQRDEVQRDEVQRDAPRPSLRHLTLDPVPTPAIVEEGSQAPTEPEHAEPTPEVAVAPVLPTEPAAALTAPVTDESLADREERQVFERAQQLHFGGASARDAVGGWDRYLATYPDGHFAPEARYNRALALVRAGRLDEARAALQPIAAAGGSRARESRALLDAIAGRR